MKANIDFVSDRLAIGGDFDIHDPERALAQLESVRAAGITHIVDCRLEWTDERFVRRHAPEMVYLHNPTDDDGRLRPDEFFERGVGFALEALANPDTKVLAHCHMGINRGPSLGFAILLARGHGAVEAMEAIRRARPIAVTGYAPDALEWFQRTTGVDTELAGAERRALARWLADNHLDAVRVIRTVREAA
ncbi:MAG: dual specificity protein phosphatase family protein [Microthrixaceae bacterium]